MPPLLWILLLLIFRRQLVEWIGCGLIVAAAIFYDGFQRLRGRAIPGSRIWDFPIRFR